MVRADVRRFKQRQRHTQQRLSFVMRIQRHCPPRGLERIGYGLVHLPGLREVIRQNTRQLG